MKRIKLLFALLLIYFSAFSQAPTITSFSPASGPVGTLVTVAGTNLTTPTAFTIGDVEAIVVSGSNDTLVGMVMPEAVTGTVSITNLGGSATTIGSFTVTPTLYPTTQMGNKLVGTDSIGQSDQGVAVAISADGSTAIVGGPGDNNDTGAVWIYTRTGSGWTQQGPKLIGTGGILSGISHAIGQGSSVALSADGNTAIVGGPKDSDDMGAVWFFRRNAGTWTQQGSKMVGTGAVNVGGDYIHQGVAVALSADGNTAIVGGSSDNYSTGAAWIYTRSGTTWTQQGNKLVGTGSAGEAFQGVSVALSVDGNTAVVGGPGDSSYRGSAWVYTRSGSIWTQQGSKLVGTGCVGSSSEGGSVAISADGNTAIIGGRQDSAFTGAVWIFVRTGSTWTQQGSKLLGSGAVGSAAQGNSVSLSADGNTAVEGGNLDDPAGAVWVFYRTGNTWTQQANKLVGTGSAGLANQGASVSLSADGKKVIIGGFADNNQIGAAWFFGLACSADSSHVTDSVYANTMPYFWNGATFTGPGTKTAYLTGNTGCDSVATLVLTVLPNGINNIANDNPIHLYPNPNKGSFTIETSNSIGSPYTISDMLGHVIMQQTIKSDNDAVELPDASEGVYTLTVKGSQPFRFVIVR